jgi:NAD(P)-dependent dehydrogenase (short-subunit alcohol dehydrogenase family)
MFEWLFGKSFDPEKAIPSLEGKVVLVTGGKYHNSMHHSGQYFDLAVGNVGLGKEMITQLAKHDPKEIFLAARTPSKAEAAIDDIKKNVPNANISYLKMDLTSFASIKSAVDEFQSRSSRLDILCNNAGVLAMPFSLTEDGYEIQFGTNHMGHFLLTKLLMPTLLRTAEESGSDVRIINLSSSGHQMAPLPHLVYNQAELEKWNTWRRYGQSKLANMYHARELLRRYPSITATSVHPGYIMTDIYNTAQKGAGFFARMGYRAMSAVFSDVPTGTKNQLWAATAPKEVVRSSYYWTPIGVKSAGSFWMAKNEKNAAELWDWSEKELERQGY